jgi:hypothetical protein
MMVTFKPGWYKETGWILFGLLMGQDGLAQEEAGKQHSRRANVLGRLV